MPQKHPRLRASALKKSNNNRVEDKNDNNRVENYSMEVGLFSNAEQRASAIHLQPIGYALQPITQMHRIEVDEQAEFISRQT